MQVNGSIPNRVLVFHAEAAEAACIATLLRGMDFDITTATKARDMLATLRSREFPVAIINLNDTINPTNTDKAGTFHETVQLPEQNAEAQNENASRTWRTDAGLRLNNADGSPSQACYGSEKSGGNPLGRHGESNTLASLDLLRAIRRASPLTRIVAIVTPGLALEVCCQAVTLGVCSFLDACDSDLSATLNDRITQAMDRYATALQQSRDNDRNHIFDETGLAGQSRRMADLLIQAKRAALISDVPILIQGESGTGKQLIAEAIHRLDPKRKNQPFLSVNCAAIQGSLAEAALFGHVRGAFTGAVQERPGYFRAARGGTILLDEISELEPALQPKLLRVLQAGKVLPVGSDTEVDVHARVIAASNRALAAMVQAGDFRLDLYQRLHVITLDVPPLRERPEDIPLLVQYFLRKYASYYPRGIDDVDPRVYDVLTDSIGSGNVRELENTIRQILVFKDGGNRLELSDLPQELLTLGTAGKARSDQIYSAMASAASWMIRSGRWTLQQMVDEFERLALSEALDNSQTTHSDLASKLGITRRTLYNKIREHGLGDTPQE